MHYGVCQTAFSCFQMLIGVHGELVSPASAEGVVSNSSESCPLDSTTGHAQNSNPQQQQANTHNTSRKTASFLSSVLRTLAAVSVGLLACSTAQQICAVLMWLVTNSWLHEDWLSLCGLPCHLQPSCNLQVPSWNACHSSSDSSPVKMGSLVFACSNDFECCS